MLSIRLTILKETISGTHSCKSELSIRFYLEVVIIWFYYPGFARRHSKSADFW